MKWQQRIVTALVVSYVVAFVIWRALVATPLGAVWWPLRVGEIFAVWAWLPLPFLVVAALLWRTRWGLIALLVPIGWFAIEYGGLFLPTSSSVARASGEGTSLRVMTFNTYNMYGHSSQFIATVEELQPDIFVLQETNPYFVGILRSNAPAWPYSHYANVRVTGRVAIFSKWPILSFESDNEQLGCHCAQALLQWHDKDIRVIVVHIRSPSFGPRGWGKTPELHLFDTSKQVSAYGKLIPLIEGSSEPVIVVGDFNTIERQPGYELLYGAGMKDAHEEAGWGLGLTYPAPFRRYSWLPFSLIRIDHLFYDESWKAMRAETLPLLDSDHQAVWADMQWVGRN